MNPNAHTGIAKGGPVNGSYLACKSAEYVVAVRTRSLVTVADWRAPDMLDYEQHRYTWNPIYGYWEWKGQAS